MTDERMNHCRHCGPKCQGGKRRGFDGLRWAHTSAKGAAWRPGECPACEEVDRIESELRQLLEGVDTWGLWSRVSYPRRYRTGMVRGLRDAVRVVVGEKSLL